MNVTDWRLKALGAAVAIALIAGAGAAGAWWITSTKYDADIANLNGKHAKERAEWDREKVAITTKAQQDTAAAIQRTNAAQEAAAAADKAAQEKLANAKRENDALRNDVAAGRKRVSILSANLAAANRASGNAAGGSSAGGSMGDAVQIELSATGGQTVLDLRESTQRDSEVIQYLQNYIIDVVKQCKR